MIANSPERRAVQQGAIVEVQNKYRRVGSSCIDFFQGRHAPFRKLKFGPTTDHTHPLWRGGARCLILQHSQRIGDGRYTVPA